MKTILVPTDFSIAAKNAVAHAASLAQTLKARLILFHSFQIQMPSPEFPVMTMAPADLQVRSEKILQKETLRIRKRYGVKAEAHSIAGLDPSGEILRLTKKIKPELVIMGMKEKGLISEILVGSTATSVMRNIKIPVLIVPEKAKFVKPKKILLAYDYTTPSGKEVLLPLSKIAKSFKSEIFVVNVLEKGESPSPAKSRVYLTLDRSLRGIDHSYYFPKNNNLRNGIDEFVTDHKASMVAMVPHRHDLIERLFGKSNTKSIAFHTRIPLLALPDRYKRYPAYFI